MVVESPEDRAAFFADFGDSAIWTPAASGVASDEIAGHFDNAHTEVLSDELGAGIDASMPRFECNARAVDGIKQGDGFAITPAHSGVQTAYKVAGLHPDGTGMITLFLHKA